MDQEISKGTWVGATILAIVAILGLSFAVYGIARSLVNNSSADFVSTVDGVGTSSFNDFDGTTVSGLQVRSAIDTYEGDKIAILVNTAGIEEALKSASTKNTAAFVRQEAVKPEVDLLINFNGKYYMNYNALFVPETADDGKLQIPLKDTTSGYLQYSGHFAMKTVDGKVTSDLLFNSLKSNFKTSGCSEFIATGSNFNAKLIKDASGTVVGILFSQVY